MHNHKKRQPFCCKMWQKYVTKCVRFFITKYDIFLQNATGIAKCNSFITNVKFMTKMRYLLAKYEFLVNSTVSNKQFFNVVLLLGLFGQLFNSYIRYSRYAQILLFQTTPSPCACACVISLHPSFPIVWVYRLFEKRYDRDVFRELLSIKEPQKSLQNKETTAQSYPKLFQIKTSKKAVGSSLGFKAVSGRWGWIMLAIWIVHFILLLFCKEPAKKINGIHTLTAEPPPLCHTSQYAFSWMAPPPNWV